MQNIHTAFPLVLVRIIEDYASHEVAIVEYTYHNRVMRPEIFDTCELLAIRLISTGSAPPLGIFAHLLDTGQLSREYIHSVRCTGSQCYALYYRLALAPRATRPEKKWIMKTLEDGGACTVCGTWNSILDLPELINQTIMFVRRPQQLVMNCLLHKHEFNISEKSWRYIRQNLCLICHNKYGDNPHFLCRLHQEKVILDMDAKQVDEIERRLAILHATGGTILTYGAKTDRFLERLHDVPSWRYSITRALIFAGALCAKKNK